ncbi:chemotaxis protein CheB [Yoonia sp. BS5-3]|uniref:Chemotaxis protein CheB n=1 Tax=Yoonia phaeophyticola TaxID=3137369 RepID=A0ABZ2V555_9RHOB
MDQPAKTDTEANPRQMGKVDESFYLIGVGASAGGLDAIKQLLSQIQPGFPHSLVIVQHISPDYKSLMSEILGRETTLPVQEVTDNMAVEAGQIYLIPPRSNILIQGTKGDSGSQVAAGTNGKVHSGLRFSLAEPTPRPGLNLPIDVFFHSLAEAVQDRAIAVILSGSGSDGSRGMRAIKDHEGFVLVQDPDMAAFDGMPRSAIATGIVDIVLAPDLMVGEINRYIEMRVRGIDNVDRLFAKAGDSFTKLLERVSETAEIDFSLYKEPTLKRRVARRMALKGFTDLEEYLDYLKRDAAEANVLYREFLVGVTNFFRDLPVWRNLQQTILPELFAHGHEDEPLRIWSVGCSTGEEAYTIAMLMEEYRSENDVSREYRIFATDVNERAIQTAKQGVYPDSVREEIPAEYLNRGFLTFQSGTFSVAPMIRNRVVFSVHNAIEDPPFTRTDLIVCRNLLIYLSPEVQAKIMTHFSFSLRKGGILQLGAAETTGPHGAMFDALMHKSRIYRNTRQVDFTGRRGTRPSDFAATRFLPRSHSLSGRSHIPGDDVATLLQFTMDDERTCICIADENGKITRTFGNHTGLLDIPTSGFSANLLDLVDERLRSSVALVLRRSEMEGFADKKGVRLIHDDQIEVLDISSRKISWEAKAVAFAITFRRRDETAISLGPAPQTESTTDMPTQAYIQHLENEVQSLQDMLSATAEDLGASNEELQTTNEELIASNEELQANNEETQSINEELHTLNAENADKIADLEAATADINNLLETAELGVLVLGEDLTIRQFSTGLRPYIALEQTDIGRPLENFAIQFEHDSIQKFLRDIRQSQEHGSESSRELMTYDEKYAFCRIRPYRNVHGERSGVVVTLQDNTEVRRLAEEVSESIKLRELEVRRRSEEIRRFALAAAHDLIQPINTIDSSLSVLKESLPEDVSDELNTVVGFLGSSAGRMRTRVESILDFARLQESELELRPLSLTEIAKNALQDLDAQVKDTGAKITLGDLPDAMGAERMIMHVFQNLISNALKFRDLEKDCLIDIQKVDAPDDMVAFRVADNGIGIPQEFREKVFEPFARLNTKERFPGDGMGLTLIMQILQHIGGSIKITDGIDGGAAFIVTLQSA